MKINAKTTLCCVIGNPIEHSLSPTMHNAGYEALDLNFAYLALRVEDIKNAVSGIRSLGIRGVSVTIPHKKSVMAHLDAIDPLAKKIGAVNTIVNTNAGLKGYNTDCEGAIHALEERTSIKGKRAVILGAGGAARAIAFGLKEKGAIVTLANRTRSNAEILAKDVGALCIDISDKESVKESDIIINATSVGMSPLIENTVLEENILTKTHIVMDIVYNPKETKLLTTARKKGCTIVYGYKMLLYQAITQFELFTSKKAPVEVMETALLERLGE